MIDVAKKADDQGLSEALGRVMSNRNNQRELNEKLRANRAEFDEREKDTTPTAELMMLPMTL